MLPNSPRPKHGGLPSGPRSRSIGPSRQQNARRSDEGVPLPSRRVRQQRSVSSLALEMSAAEPPPSLPLSSESSRGWPRKYTPQSPQTPLSDDSMSPRLSQDSSSASSSVSSIFDRVKSGAASYASSLTSVEDSSKELDVQHSRERRKQRVLSPESVTSADRFETERTDTGTGDGYTVWNRVAAAASTLTISVSKAWASNVSMFPGEETPPGQESRLTRAMKAYHIDKARDPTELPEFLFAEHERQPRKRAEVKREVTPRNAGGTRGRTQESGGSEAAFTRSINRSTALNNSTEPSKQTQKGTDRLKALREAKRSQATSDTQVHTEQVASLLPRPKVGLPSTPGPRRR
ncbi:hypothetical protein GGU10DRAFT_289880 [Lentinula aff. detonsa]|uniref:Uncharacterized protein n=1 Tax=Lentinula aff. detonsa TaxID=2804958 RepID=A0AA38L531_9AGAR|nr:hypothetical protein GGU10DRAFT_289880 [Lentinula aff. detonsa]